MLVGSKGGSMRTVTAVFDAVCCFDIEVPDDATEQEMEAIAGEWLDENIDLVSSAIDESQIDVKEVWA